VITTALQNQLLNAGSGEKIHWCVRKSECFQFPVLGRGCEKGRRGWNGLLDVAKFQGRTVHREVFFCQQLLGWLL